MSVYTNAAAPGAVVFLEQFNFFITEGTVAVFACGVDVTSNEIRIRADDPYTTSDMMFMGCMSFGGFNSLFFPSFCTQIDVSNTFTFSGSGDITTTAETPIILAFNDLYPGSTGG